MNNLSPKITELPSLENVIARKLLYMKIISRSVYSKRRNDRKKNCNCEESSKKDSHI